MSKDIKFYVVWEWAQTWIFDSWESCKNSVIWFPNAKYKSFSNKEDAEIALKKWWKDYYKIKEKNTKLKIDLENIKRDIPFFQKWIAVDAACSDNPWKMEYRWVDLSSWQEIFHKNFEVWTNNIWEFLAIVHWLKYIWNNDMVIYSDSKIGISWVKQWKCKTQFKLAWPNSSGISNAIKDAELWLAKNKINHDILKWNTEKRWEIPADFWRK